jgi:hypothetical protein
MRRSLSLEIKKKKELSTKENNHVNMLRRLSNKISEKNENLMQENENMNKQIISLICLLKSKDEKLKIFSKQSNMSQQNYIMRMFFVTRVVEMYKKLYLRKIEVIRSYFRLWVIRASGKKKFLDKSFFNFKVLGKIKSELFVSNNMSLLFRSKAFYYKICQMLINFKKYTFYDFLIRVTAFANFKFNRKNMLLFRKILISKKLKWFIVNKYSNDLKYFFDKMRTNKIQSIDSRKTSLLFILDRIYWKDILKTKIYAFNIISTSKNETTNQEKYSISIDCFSLLELKKIQEEHKKLENKKLELLISNNDVFIKSTPKKKKPLSITNYGLLYKSYPLIKLQKIVNKSPKQDLKKYIQFWKYKTKIFKLFEIIDTYKNIEEDFTDKLKDVEESYENSISMWKAKNNELQNELVKVKQAYQLQSKAFADLNEKFQNYDKFMEYYILI